MTVMRDLIAARLDALIQGDAGTAEAIEAIQQAAAQTFGQGALVHRDVYIVSDAPTRDGMRHLTVDAHVLPPA